VKILPQVLDLISEKQTVMDVGSTKSGIVAAIKNHPKRKRYVAFHPMWGTENSGQNLLKKKVFLVELP
jgi:prephenate dehydrogenase